MLLAPTYQEQEGLIEGVTAKENPATKKQGTNRHIHKIGLIGRRGGNYNLHVGPDRSHRWQYRLRLETAAACLTTKNSN